MVNTWFWRLRATSAADFLKQDMKFGPVIHVITNPLECAIGPMLHINEINLQRKIGYNHIAC